MTTMTEQERGAMSEQGDDADAGEQRQCRKTVSEQENSAIAGRLSQNRRTTP